MLASTMQHSTNNHTPTPPPPPPTHTRALDDQSRRRPRKNTNRCLLRTQQCAKPNTFQHVFAVFHPATPEHPDQTAGTNCEKGVNLLVKGGLAPHNTWELLRKEVIQPHLPVRLPCYDFVLIASPTFDNSLPYGLGR